jgi:CAAX protease family protein
MASGDPLAEADSASRGATSTPVRPGVTAPVGVLWRGLIFLLATSVGVLGLRVVVSPLSAQLESALHLRLPAFVLTLTGGLLVGHWWTFRVAEPNGWEKIGLTRHTLTFRAIGTGILLGAVAIGVPSLLLFAIGWLRLAPAAAGSSLLAAATSLGVLLPAALWEELFARGYLFALVRERFGARPAIVATGLLFGLMHLENVGATAQSVLLVSLAGILLGCILVATGSLWASWAAHVAWNFVIAAGMHAAVSGIGMGAPNYRTINAGPDWATGGVWGPEAGLFTALGIVACMGILFRRRLRRGA